MDEVKKKRTRKAATTTKTRSGRKKVDDPNICKVCAGVILVTIFRGTGWCCDVCRKKLLGELPMDYVIETGLTSRP